MQYCIEYVMIKIFQYDMHMEWFGSVLWQESRSVCSDTDIPKPIHCSTKGLSPSLFSAALLIPANAVLWSVGQRVPIGRYGAAYFTDNSH